jgi:hypothetical protein
MPATCKAGRKKAVTPYFLTNSPSRTWASRGISESIPVSIPATCFFLDKRAGESVIVWPDFHLRLQER